MTITAAGVLNHEMDWKGAPPITDAEIETDCEQCARAVSLGSCRTEQTGQGMLYRCSSCPETVLIVQDFVPGSATWPGRGFRLGQWVLRNIAPLRFRGILMPASPNASIE